MSSDCVLQIVDIKGLKQMDFGELNRDIDVI